MQILDPTIRYNISACLALGFFDCVHLGHKKLIEKVKKQASLSGSGVGILTFTNSPYNYFGSADKLILTFDERLKVFGSLGIEYVLAIKFDREFMNKTQDEFLKLLTDVVNLRGVVSGYDYRFGQNATGKVEDLADFAAKNHIMSDIVPQVLYDGQRISATLIKEKLTIGDVAFANELMGHRYFIDDVVCHGRGVGKTFDFPTANLQIDENKMLPMKGVYATFATVDGREYRSVTNVGDKPTFGESSTTVETLLQDFSGDLYGKRISVSFVKRLRDIKTFSSPQALRDQIFQDAQWRQ